jgi:uncharacterized protein (TIGR00299 family) protein
MSRRSSTGSDLLHFDAFSGAAGNMVLGALVDLGVPRSALEEELAGLGLDFRFRIRRVRRGVLAARHLDVLVPQKAKSAKGRGRYASGNREPRPGMHPHAQGRSFAQICTLLRKAKLAGAVRARALAIFEELARAEAKVHGTKLEQVHFHEVGAVDAIVDITGAAAAIEWLGVSRITCSPIALGHGSVETAHGRLPLPAPATLELLRGIPTAPAHVAWETVTPTGAAILRVCVDTYEPLPAMRVTAIGHGAGGDRPGPMPNVLRAVLGSGAAVARDRIVVLETNLDDLVPEHFEFLMERLFEAGALDISLQHLQMKKNRPGFLVRALARPADRTEVARALFAHSTAIGVRTSEWDRIVLEREERRVDTSYGRIRVKVVRDLDGRESASAEYEDCKRAATKHGAALRDVVCAAEAALRKGGK